MPVSMHFDVSHRYAEVADGIEVPIILSDGRQSVELLAKLDTGAAFCIFERKYGEMLELHIESGRLQRFRTVAGSFGAYEHEVTIQTLGIEFSAAVLQSSSPRTLASAGTFWDGPAGLTACASPSSIMTVCSCSVRTNPEHGSASCPSN
jgi:hypothetical protein